MCLLVPYMWPRGSVRLQALLVLCVGLLALERVINVFVPIYSRNIGETRLIYTYRIISKSVAISYTHV